MTYTRTVHITCDKCGADIHEDKSLYWNARLYNKNLLWKPQGPFELFICNDCAESVLGEVLENTRQPK